MLLRFSKHETRMDSMQTDFFELTLERAVKNNARRLLTIFSGDVAFGIPLCCGMQYVAEWRFERNVGDWNDQQVKSRIV